MKKIVASVGMVAVGVTGACAAYAPGLSSMDTSKAWSVSASLRGFYDDNYLTAANNESDSFGFGVSPSIRFNLPLDQTYFGARYTYSGRYYEDRDAGTNDPWDHSHQFDLLFNHAFSERYSLDVRDSFVIAQEPQALGVLVTDPFRTEGDNIRNLAQASFKAQMTRLLSLTAGYNNVLWDYEGDNGNAGAPSRSGLLDRIEHLASLELGWQVLPETKAFAGYKFGAVQYTSDEVIVNFGGAIGTRTSDIRDNFSHYLYGGMMQNFAHNISASGSIGATCIDYQDDQFNDDTWIPYANISASWGYATGSSLQVGFLHSFNQTDTIAPNAVTGEVTSSQESSAVFAVLSHEITPKLVGSINAQYQYSDFQGGQFDSSTDELIVLGLNVEYAITSHLAVEAGYNFDDLSSDGAHPSFDRNRVYLGITASY